MVSKMKGYYACNYSLPLGCVMICNVLELAGLTSHGPRPDMWTPEAFWQNNTQHWMRQPKLGCGTQMLTSVHHHFLVHNMYIYIRPVLGISPVWKSTKTSQNPLVHFHPHSKSSVLDTLYPSVSNLSSDLTPTPFPIIHRPQ